MHAEPTKILREIAQIFKVFKDSPCGEKPVNNHNYFSEILLLNEIGIIVEYPIGDTGTEFGCFRRRNKRRRKCHALLHPTR